MVDNYDSFTYNLVHLIRELSDAELVIKRNDAFNLEEVETFDKIILSPGPGLPEEAGNLMNLLKQYSPSKDILGISEEVEELFLEYDWPGNVRELEHVIESSINFTQNNKIELFHLPVYLSEKIESNRNKDIDLNSCISLDYALETVEREMIMGALKKTGGNVSKAANILKVTRQRLHYKIDKYGIKEE